MTCPIFQFDKLDFVAPKEISIEENRVVRIEYQLRMLHIDLVVVKAVHQTHQGHWMDRCSKFIDEKRSAGSKR